MRMRIRMAASGPRVRFVRTGLSRAQWQNCRPMLSLFLKFRASSPTHAQKMPTGVINHYRGRKTTANGTFPIKISVNRPKSGSSGKGPHQAEKEQERVTAAPGSQTSKKRILITANAPKSSVTSKGTPQDARFWCKQHLPSGCILASRMYHAPVTQR